MDTNDRTPVEVPRPLRRCADCAYLDPIGPICRRRSPRAIPTPGKLPGAVGSLVVWPPVNPDRDWCGEWSAASAQEMSNREVVEDLHPR